MKKKRSFRRGCRSRMDRQKFLVCNGCGSRSMMRTRHWVRRRRQPLVRHSHPLPRRLRSRQPARLRPAGIPCVGGRSPPAIAPGRSSHRATCARGRNARSSCRPRRRRRPPSLPGPDPAGPRGRRRRAAPERWGSTEAARAGLRPTAPRSLGRSSRRLPDQPWRPQPLASEDSQEGGSAAAAKEYRRESAPNVVPRLPRGGRSSIRFGGLHERPRQPALPPTPEKAGRMRNQLRWLSYWRK